MSAETDNQTLAMWRALALLSRRVQGRLEQRLQKEADISVPDFEILSALRSATDERMRAGELGEMLSWEKSRVSHHVSRMENRGLVERVACPIDQRGTWVGITARGQEALSAASEPFHDEINRALGASVGQTSAITQQLIVLLENQNLGACQAEADHIRRSLEG